MTTETIIELVGYLGSLLVLVSFLMTSVFKLRIVNSVGSLIFMTYALIIHSYPTAIMNFCLVLINIHFLWKMRHQGKEYNLIKLDPKDGYLRFLLNRQWNDIEKCFPGINVDAGEADCVYLVTCGNDPAGITVALQGDNVLNFLLDYSLPEYRDFSIGKFLFAKIKEDGINRVIYSGPAENHILYLDKMGFRKSGNHYIKDLS